MKMRPMALTTSTRAPFLASISGGAAARRAGRIVDRPDQARRALDEDQRLLLVPGMIAERDGVGAGVEQFAIDRLGDAEAAGGVLAVDDDEIELPVARSAPAGARSTMVRPLRPTTSPTKRMRMLNAPRRSITSRSVSTRSSRASRGVAGTAANFLRREGDADGGDRLARAQPRDGHVVIAGAIADAMAGAVEGQKRHQQNVGIDLRRLGLRLADAPYARDRAARPERHARMTSGLPRPATAGSASCAPASASLLQQRQRIDLALERHEAGDDRCPARSASGNFRAAIASAAALRASAGSASRRAMRLAAKRRPWIRSTLADAASCQSYNECGAAPAVGALIPGTYISRWAPYDRAHGPGQGQLPSGS